MEVKLLSPELEARFKAKLSEYDYLVFCALAQNWEEQGRPEEVPFTLEHLSELIGDDDTEAILKSLYRLRTVKI